MSYLDDAASLGALLERAPRGLLGRRPPLTFEGHGLGLSAHAGEITGRPNVYPYHQELTRGDWLAGVLGAKVTTRSGAQTVDRGALGARICSCAASRGARCSTAAG